jgi:farnesyl-diphosphate farnesyltransferase
MRHLVGITHGHLRKALEYTLAIPSDESGIRRFLIWAALLAASTLRNISADPLFTSGAHVKVSRRKVKTIVALSHASIRSNFGLSALFNAAARGLPLESGNGSSTAIGKEANTQ